MNTERKHIYIEGMDMCGKDTVANIVAQDLNITNIQKLSLVDPNPFNVDKNKIVVPDDLLFGVYLAKSIIYDLEQWSPLMTRQLQVSFTGIRSASYRVGFPDGLGPVFEELLKYSPLFDNAFLLTASFEARKKRLALKREKSSDHDYLIETSPEKVILIDASMVELATKEMGAMIIDTSNMTPEQIALEIQNIISGFKQRDQIIGVRLDTKNIKQDKPYFEKELDRYYSFIIRKNKLNV